MSILVFNISNLVLFILFCYLTSGEWKKNKRNLIIIVLIQLLKIIFSQNFNPITNLITGLILNFCILLTFTCKLSKKMSLLFIYMCFSVISEEMGLLVMENILDERILPDSLNFYLLNFMSQFFLLMLIIVSGIILKTVKNQNVSWKDSMHILVFPLSTILFVVVSRYPLYYNGMNFGYLFSILFFLIATITNCIELYIIQRNNQIKIAYGISLEKQKSDKEYYELLLKKTEKEKQVIHDMSKHDQYLCLLLKNKKVDEAINYLNQNMKNRSNEHVVVTQNKTLDLIIHMYKDEILDNKIAIDVSNVCKVNLDKIYEVDQCTIFANILENAIESCIRSSEKKIVLSLKQDDRRILFKVENTCNEVLRQDNEYKTLKTKGYHGLGLKNVKECIKKYNGLMKIDFIDNVFITIIVINNKQL